MRWQAPGTRPQGLHPSAFSQQCTAGREVVHGPCIALQVSTSLKAYKVMLQQHSHKAHPSNSCAMLQVSNSLKAVRDRINSVKNTQKITDAMKLVAAAKVRRAQDAVINGRPFSENLVKVSRDDQTGETHQPGIEGCTCLQSTA